MKKIRMIMNLKYTNGLCKTCRLFAASFLKKWLYPKETVDNFYTVISFIDVLRAIGMNVC
jgi:hypothetical protein